MLYGRAFFACAATSELYFDDDVDAVEVLEK